MRHEGAKMRRKTKSKYTSSLRAFVANINEQSDESEKSEF